LGASPVSPTIGSSTQPPIPSRPHTFSVPITDAPTPADRWAARRARSEASHTLQSSPDPQARERAAMELSGSGEADIIRPLVSALDDRSQDVREKAALGLALTSSPEVIPALLKALSDPDSQVREKAAIGLALRRDPRIVDALIAAMDDPDSQVREKVAIALGTSGDARAAGPLERALKDPDPQVREKAISGLLLLRTGSTDTTGSDRVRDQLRGLVGAILRLTK
jgi:HEAT repeat protein